ncbi:hypothetical protein Leryth_007692 [Lithospermum erythrorhizon]|nr:hypothetical protein Leryth_007692 [Lithospermum erythrorhizon]
MILFADDQLVKTSFPQDDDPGLLGCAEVCIDWVLACYKSACDCFTAIYPVGFCFPEVWLNHVKIRCSSHNDCSGIGSANSTKYCIRSIGALKGFCISSESKLINKSDMN